MTARGARGARRGRGRAPVVTHNPEGWPDPHSRRLKLCNVQNIGACAGLPVWRVESYGRGYVSTAYFCDVDLPDEYRRQAAPSTENPIGQAAPVNPGTRPPFATKPRGATCQSVTPRKM